MLVIFPTFFSPAQAPHCSVHCRGITQNRK